MSDERQSLEHHDRQKAHFGADDPVNLNFFDLATNADSIWRDLSSLDLRHREEHKHHAWFMIAALFKLGLHLDKDRDAYRQFIISRKAHSDYNNDLFFIVTLGIMRGNNPKKGKTLRTIYAQACMLLYRNGIDPDNATDWLAEPVYDAVEDKKLVGLSKTKYLWALEPEGVAARRKKEAHIQKLAAAPLRHLLGSDYGVVGKDATAADLTTLSEGRPVLALVQIVEGKPVLKNLLTSDPILMAPVVKRCLKSRISHITKE